MNLSHAEITSPIDWENRTDLLCQLSCRLRQRGTLVTNAPHGSANGRIGEMPKAASGRRARRSRHLHGERRGSLLERSYFPLTRSFVRRVMANRPFSTISCQSLETTTCLDSLTRVVTV